MYKDKFPYEMVEKLEVSLVNRYFKGILMNLYLYLQLPKKRTTRKNRISY